MRNFSNVFLLLVVVVAVVNAAVRPSASTLRALEENGYQYLEDLSQYQMQFGKCVRVKVPEDDDDAEGNSYFYNGHYYAQAQQFASVYLCESKSSSSSGDQCGVCDMTKEYVTDLATYLEITLEYAATMCQSCTAKCRRRLEEENDEYMNVDCSSCSKTCANMNFNYANSQDNGDENGDNNAYDETQYLECQEAFQDEDGVQIYAGPQCDSEGDIIIGFYYDEDCMVKSSSAVMDYGFEYGTFRGVQSICLTCDAYGNGEDDVCKELYDDATHCSNGKDLSGEEGDLPICKSYQNAHKEHYYGKRQGNWKLLETIIVVIVVGGLFLAFLALSWTYYLRHRSLKASAKVPLTSEDHISEPEIIMGRKEDSMRPMS